MNQKSKKIIVITGIEGFLYITSLNMRTQGNKAEVFSVYKVRDRGLLPESLSY